MNLFFVHVSYCYSSEHTWTYIKMGRCMYIYHFIILHTLPSTCISWLTQHNQALAKYTEGHRNITYQAKILISSLRVASVTICLSVLQGRTTLTAMFLTLGSDHNCFSSQSTLHHEIYIKGHLSEKTSQITTMSYYCYCFDQMSHASDFVVPLLWSSTQKNGSCVKQRWCMYDIKNCAYRVKCDEE